MSPTDLQFYEISDKKIVLTWSGPSGNVSGYRVTALPLDESDSPQREMTLPISQNSYIEVSHLEPGTSYRFSVYTILNGEESLPLIGEQTTSECKNQSDLKTCSRDIYELFTQCFFFKHCSCLRSVLPSPSLPRARRSHRYPLRQHHRGQSCDDVVCPSRQNYWLPALPDRGGLDPHAAAPALPPHPVHPAQPEARHRVLRHAARGAGQHAE